MNYSKIKFLTFFAIICSIGVIAIPALATHSETDIGEIHGIKWNDANGNGIFDFEESVLENITIHLTTSAFNSTTGNFPPIPIDTQTDNFPRTPIDTQTGNFTTNLIHTTTTDVYGAYNFTGLLPNQYYVSEILPSFSIQTFPIDGEPHVVDITTTTDVLTNINFGNQLVGPGGINGTIFQDVTNIGVFDSGDTLLQNTYVYLYKFTSTSASPSWVTSTQPNMDGDYGFGNLEPGIYKVTSSPGFWPSTQTVPINNEPAIVTISGNIVIDVNLGYNSDFGTIKGTTFIDTDGNGVHDVGNPPTPDEDTLQWTGVCASPGDTCTSSNSVGDYELHLPPGTYDIHPGWSSFAVTPTFTTITVPSLSYGQVISDVDLPYYLDLIPLPSDMDITTSSGDIGGVPTLVRSQDLIITKNITFCTPVDDPKVTLTLSDGTILEESMQNTGSEWSVNFGPVASGQSTANIRVDVDCPADTIGYPEDISLIGSEDVIQIGDLIFYDPSGDVVNKCTDEPINGATATLLVAAPHGTNNFIIPQSNTHLPSTNPQITGSDGSYGWVTIPGDYKVTAQMSGFITNASPIVSIPPPVTGLDIYLTPLNGCAPNPQAATTSDGIPCDFHTTAAGALAGPYESGVHCYDGAINISSDVTIDTTGGDVTFYSGGAFTQAANTVVSNDGGNNILWLNNAAVVIGADAALSGDVQSNTSSITTGANSQIFGNIEAEGPVTLGSLSVVTGDVQSVSYVTLGAISTIVGNVMSESYVSLGALSKVTGNVTSVAYVTTGASSEIGGNVNTPAAVTLGAGSVIEGCVNSPTVTAPASVTINGSGC
jgi:predicted acyltransferase (DUF342 family)